MLLTCLCSIVAETKREINLRAVIVRLYFDPLPESLSPLFNVYHYR